VEGGLAMSHSQTVQVSVQSSLLASIAYSVHATLDLQFRSGAFYRYFTVPHTVFEGLIAAESKGTYFNHNIRNRFPYTRLA
jgi:hypothetical protein